VQFQTKQPRDFNAFKNVYAVKQQNTH